MAGEFGLLGEFEVERVKEKDKEDDGIDTQAIGEAADDIKKKRKEALAAKKKQTDAANSIDNKKKFALVRTKNTAGNIA